MSAAKSSASASPPQVPVPVWDCHFSQLEAPGAAALDSLTVGAKFAMKCHGDLPVAWSRNGIPKLVFPQKEQTYSLAIVKVVRQESNQVDLEVTAYKAGEHKPEYLRVLQDNAGFEMLKPQWNVQTVLKSEKPPQPYAPFGPFGLTLPEWVLWSCIAAAVVVVLLLLRQLRRWLQRRRVRAELQLHPSTLKPVLQFFRDARALRRRLNAAVTPVDGKAVAADLRRDFLLYLQREYQIPALRWSNREIREDLRRRHRSVYNEVGEVLKKTLRELERVQVDAQASLADLEQLYRMSVDTAEKLNASFAREQESKTS